MTANTETRKRRRIDVDLDDLNHGEMHPRNRYRAHPPDFWKLAKEFSTLRPFVHKNASGKAFIDFHNAEAVRELTFALLKKDFDLDVSFPLDTLCPPVPNRLNYILWLEDLIHETLPDEKEVVGIDIGVGASCIYPLLGCATHPHWQFLGTDISEASVASARGNVARNHLESRVSIVHNDAPLRIFLPDAMTHSQYTFCMCNPPFYASKDELEQSTDEKELPPSAVCTGSVNEMITDGGEQGFISRIIEESLVLRSRIRWYTSMIGQKKTIKPIVHLLKNNGISNYVVTEFCQGRTKRWAIAWSFGSNRVVDTYTLNFYRPKTQFVSVLPRSTTFVHMHLCEILCDLDVDFTTDDVTHIVLEASPVINTWSRAARRQRKQGKALPPSRMDEAPLFSFRLELFAKEQDTCEARISWLLGNDRDVFESFWSHVKKRVEEACDMKRGNPYQGE